MTPKDTIQPEKEQDAEAVTALPQAGKPPSRLAAAFKKAVSPKAPWYLKVARSAFLVVALFPAYQFGLMVGLPGRPLTTNERADLSQIFRNSLDYNKVRIHSSKAMDFVANPFGGELTGNVTEGHTRGNVIVIHSSFAQPDYAAPHVLPELREIETHENVHAWQFQSCPAKMTMITFTDSINTLRGVEATYDYRLAPGKDLLDYTTEQQATMITDYFLRVSKGLTPNFAENAGKPADLKPLYEQVLRRFKADPSYLRQNCATLK